MTHEINLPFNCRKHLYIGQVIRIRVSAKFVSCADEIADPVAEGCGHISAIIENDECIKVVFDDLRLETQLKDSNGR